MVAAETAITCIAAVAGQTLIPVPLLGAFVGSVAGKLVESAIRDSLGEEAESELIGRLQAYEAAAIDELDESLRAAMHELDASFGRLENLMRVASDETVNTNLRLATGVLIAECASVPRDRVLRSIGCAGELDACADGGQIRGRQTVG